MDAILVVMMVAAGLKISSSRLVNELRKEAPLLKGAFFLIIRTKALKT